MLYSISYFEKKLINLADRCLEASFEISASITKYKKPQTIGFSSSFLSLVLKWQNNICITIWQQTNVYSFVT